MRLTPSLRCLVVALTMCFGPVATAMPQHFVYKGGGCDGAAALPIYEALLGQKVDGATDFFDQTSSWSHAVASAQWLSGCWKGVVPNLAVSVPLAVNGGGDTTQQMGDIAAGKMDVYYSAMARALVKNGFSHAYIRLGLEMNGGWFPWTAAGRPAHYIAAFRHVVPIFRAVSPDFKIVWNPSIFVGGISPSQVYPGDEFVDVVGQDAYNTSWGSTRGDNTEPALWNSVHNDSWGVAQFVAFARTHGKPYAFPEWGTGFRPDGHGGGDDPTYITNMIPYLQGALFEGNWDYNAGDYAAQMTDGAHNLAASAFAKAFTSRDSLITRSASPWSEPNPLTVTCVSCHAGIVQNGPAHWIVIVWASAQHPSATVTWGFHAHNVRIYDSALAKSPSKTLADTAFTSIVLIPNKPLVISLQK